MRVAFNKINLSYQRGACRTDPQQLQMRFRKLRGRRQALLVSLFAGERMCEGVDCGQSDWVRSDKNAIDAPRTCRRYRFSSQPPWFETSKPVRRPPALGGGKPLIPVQCRQTPQMLEVARRQVHLRHQLRADRADPSQLLQLRLRELGWRSAFPHQLDHVSAGARWRLPFPASPCRTAKGGRGHGGAQGLFGSARAGLSCSYGHLGRYRPIDIAPFLGFVLPKQLGINKLLDR